jgi:hypothetical protein
MNNISKTINDIVDDKDKFINSNANGSFKGVSIGRETRNEGQHEDLAHRLAEIIGVTDDNLKPYLAASYSGIPRTVLERLAVEAKEDGYNPPGLFQYKLKQHPLWQDYQKKRDDKRRINNEA